MSNVTSFPTIPNRSPESSQLIDLLKDGKIGDVLTDEQLTEHCGQTTSPSTAGRPNSAYQKLNGAIRYVLRNHGVVWERVKGTGYIKCLDASEKVTSAGTDLKAVRRRTRRACTKLAAVNLVDLPEEERRKAITLGAQLGTIELFARPNTARALEAREINKPPKLENALAAFA